MRIVMVLAALAVLVLAGCGTTYEGGSPMIDVPTAPFPYNSKFCT